MVLRPPGGLGDPVSSCDAARRPSPRVAYRPGRDPVGPRPGVLRDRGRALRLPRAGVRVLDRRLRAARVQRGTDPALRACRAGVRAPARAARRPPAAPAQEPHPSHDAPPLGADAGFAVRALRAAAFPARAAADDGALDAPGSGTRATARLGGPGEELAHERVCALGVLELP